MVDLDASDVTVTLPDADQTVNCLPVTAGWHYLVRVYHPREAMLNGSWRFPDAEPVPAKR